MSDLIANHQPTMSSREIAELVESRHDNVKITIERLVERGLIASPATQEKATAGRPVIEYLIGKRDSYVVVAQLSPEFTARLVDRWQELEAGAAAQFNIPRSLPEALRLAADQAERIAVQGMQIATLAPKAAAYERFLEADGLIGLQNAGRALHCHPNLFVKSLIPEYCFRDSRNTPVAKQLFVDRKLFVNKAYDAPNGKVYMRAWLTTKGLDYLSTRTPPEIRSGNAAAPIAARVTH